MINYELVMELSAMKRRRKTTLGDNKTFSQSTVIIFFMEKRIWNNNTSATNLVSAVLASESRTHGDNSPVAVLLSIDLGILEHSQRPLALLA
jgi:hypothetical protein